jgi:hypothetical protein
MATLRQSKQIVAGYPVPSAVDAVNGMVAVSEFLVPSGMVINDVIEMGAIPEGMIVTDAWVACEDLDSGGPTITLSAGIISGVYGVVDNARTCGAEFFAASTVGQAGGVARANVAAGFLLTPNLDLVPYGLKVAAAATTPVVGAKIRMFVAMKPAPVGI